MARKLLNRLLLALAGSLVMSCGLFDFAAPQLAENHAGGATGQPGSNPTGGTGESGSGGTGVGGDSSNAGTSGGDLTTGGVSVTSGGATAVNGGGTSVATGGGSVSSGGVGVSTGGVGVSTGGVGVSTGGAGVSTGGVSVGTGGASLASGGASAAIGGSQGQGCSGAIPFPSTTIPVLDDFNRTALGSNWVNNNATATDQWSLANDTLVTNANSQDSIYWATKLGATQEVHARLVLYDENLYFALLLMKSERRDMQGFVIALGYSANFNGAKSLEIAVVDNGWQIITSRSDIKINPGSVLGGRSYPSGCVEAYVDGVLVLSTDLSKAGLTSSEFASTSSYVGIANVLNSSSTLEPTVWDDFSAGTLP
jgi:hypothetical protein